MVQNPVVQKKAQVEIRHVVGTGRLPVHDDRPNLPFVETVMTEVLRCCPAVPLASRALRSKERYGAFELPKGSLVMANVWAMLHDHERFEDPDIFKPARYTPDEEGAELTRFVYAAAFGFGRRTCPGRNFATASMWIIIATVLAAFDILPDGDKIDSGEGVDVPSLQYETGALPLLQSTLFLQM
ncbi:Cytochrome P450 78A11 [Leucoagaricus sp. SymC.cos]|nr:Cytochrome P450 78A11 [Leucoagaricus sp. SymC.cos]